MNTKPSYSKSIYSPWKLRLAYHLKPKKKTHPPFKKKQILLCNTGRLGDTFILTQILPRLSNCKTSLLISKEGKAAALGCPTLSNIHIIEPWYRSADTKREKWRKWRYFCQEAKTKKEELAAYDTVIFTNPHFCGLTPLFPNAYTIGFDTHADSSQFSQIIPWNPNTYLRKNYETMLDTLGFDPKPCISPWHELATHPHISGKYIVMHIGASDPTKDYSSSMWKQVYKKLKTQGHRILFTGKNQRHLIEAITDCQEENLSDRLTWVELLQVIAHSQLVITVDTITLHIAAAFKRPLIALYRDAPDGATWRPE